MVNDFKNRLPSILELIGLPFNVAQTLDNYLPGFLEYMFVEQQFIKNTNYCM